MLRTQYISSILSVFFVILLSFSKSSDVKIHNNNDIDSDVNVYWLIGRNQLAIPAFKGIASGCYGRHKDNDKDNDIVNVEAIEKHGKCKWFSAQTVEELEKLYNNSNIPSSSPSSPSSSSSTMNMNMNMNSTTSTKRPITISLYNIHTLYDLKQRHHPLCDKLPTALTVVESEESETSYKHMFEPSFKNFDGTSTTNPKSSIQRVYREAFLLSKKEVFLPLIPFSKLIKGGSFVSSHYLKTAKYHSNRDNIVREIKKKMRIDGLGTAFKTPVG